VRYYDGKSKLWVDAWDGRGRTGTPLAVLIEVTLVQENMELQTIRQWVAVGAS
jgi:hypothetical protein